MTATFVMFMFAARIVSAQSDDIVQPGRAKTQADRIVRWRYLQTVELRPAGEAQWYDFVLTPSVFSESRLDLGDLRLYDGKDREVPYALRVRDPEFHIEQMIAEEFNRATGPDGIHEISLDVGPANQAHNEVEVITPGIDFRRRVIVEGSEDRNEWRELADGFVLRFLIASKEVHDETIEYPPSRFRYVRVRVFPDPVVDEDPLPIASVTIRRRIEVPGEFATRPVDMGPREPVRASDAPASAWILDLGGTAVPCSQLAVTVTNSDFVRNFLIEASGPPRSAEPFRRIADGVWRRQAGEEYKDLIAEFPEIKAARLRLVVVDYRNPPLNVTSASYSAAARQVVVDRSPDVSEPLRLFYGNPDATAPRYDFARNLPERLVPEPARVELGPRQDNPLYQPEPLPLTERWPWLIYAVLGAVIAVLAVLIFNLARTAIARHDAESHPKAV